MKLALRAPTLLVVFACIVFGCIHDHYEPCAGKAPGAACRLCPADDPDCVETLQVKTCNAAGVCSGSATAGTPKGNPRNDGHAWLIDTGGGFCLSWTGIQDGPDGKTWLGSGAGLFPIDTSEPESAFPISAVAIERGPVRAMRRFGGDLFVSFGDAEVVQFSASAARTSLGPRTTTPIAVSDNGCVGVTRDHELVVRLPGEVDPKPVTLPRPPGARALYIEGAVGLADSLLVRTDRNAAGEFGALYRVGCPSMAVSEVLHGAAVQNLDTFVRDDANVIWAIDRYNGAAGARNWRLMNSKDEGKNWSAVSVPDGWQSAVIAARGTWRVVAPPKLGAILFSNDSGEHWTTEPVETYSSVADFETTSVHVSERGIVTVGANCNYLVHRRHGLP